MTWFEAFILGLVQGLTEFIPISSSGHLELGAAFFGLEEENLTFSIIVHGATFLSILVVFRKDIASLISSLFSFRWNDETKFILLLLLSAVPVAIAGLFFKEDIEKFFEGNVLFVGLMMLITALMLFLTKFAKPQNGNVTFFKAIMIGVAQTLAVLPGISRSGATISTALYLGIDKEKATRFSFLMVLIPIFGASFLEVLTLSKQGTGSELSIAPLIIGAIAAFMAGLFACSWMIKIVKKGKIFYFSAYCLVIGVIAIILGYYNIV